MLLNSYLTGSRGQYFGSLLALDFKNNVYRGSGGIVGSLAAVPGYSYARSGAKLEFDSSSSLSSFVTNTPGKITGYGYYSRPSTTNLMLQSQAIDNAPWVKSTGVVVTADTIIAPDGTTTADRYVAAASGADCYQTKTLSVTPYTLSAFVKPDASGGRYFYINMGGASNGLTLFDTTTGTVSSMTGTAANKTSGMVACPNGWFFCWFTANAVATAAAVYGFGWSTTSPAITVPNGTGGYQWQAGLYLGSSPGPVIPTTTGTITVAADALTATVANGVHTETYTFDDGSTQTFTPTISGSLWTAKTYPTLSRPLIRLVNVT